MLNISNIIVFLLFFSFFVFSENFNTFEIFPEILRKRPGLTLKQKKQQ